MLPTDQTKDAIGFEARPIDERTRLAAHGLVARLRESDDLTGVRDRVAFDLLPGCRWADRPAELGGEGREAPALRRVGRIRQPSSIGSVVAVPLADERVASPERAVPGVHEEKVGHVHRTAVLRLVTGGGAPHHGHRRDALVAAEDVIHDHLKWSELGVVDLDDNRSVVCQKTARGGEALANHDPPRLRGERVLVLGEAATRVERRIEIDAAKAPLEAEEREPPHAREVLGMHERVLGARVAVGPRGVAHEGRARNGRGALGQASHRAPGIGTTGE